MFVAVVYWLASLLCRWAVSMARCPFFGLGGTGLFRLYVFQGAQERRGGPTGKLFIRKRRSAFLTRGSTCNFQFLKFEFPPLACVGFVWLLDANCSVKQLISILQHDFDCFIILYKNTFYTLDYQILILYTSSSNFIILSL